MKTITTPFSDEQVEILKIYQQDFRNFPLTCMGAHCSRNEREDEGILVPTKDGLICPCGKVTQSWAPETYVRVDLKQALRFAEWANDNYYHFYEGRWHLDLTQESFSTIQLWNKFIDQ